MNAWMTYGAVNHDIVSSLKAHAIKDQQSFSKPMQYTFLASSHAWMMTNVSRHDAWCENRFAEPP